MKICLTAIFKDDSEIKMAKRMLESFMPHVDGLAVALTGTSGKHSKLKKLIASYGGEFVVTNPESHPKIYEKDGDYFFANFAEARNVSFKLADMKEYDWYIWADVDDVLEGGEKLHEIAKSSDKLKLDAVMFTYWYQVIQDKKGKIINVSIEHNRERLLKPKVFEWKSRLHEVAVPIDGNYKPKISEYDIDPKKGQKTVWIHLPPKAHLRANMKRNIKILEYQIKAEDKKEKCRTKLYLARTYFDTAQEEKGKERALYFEASEDLFKEYLKESGWAEERASAWEYMGDIAAFRGDAQTAIKRYHRSIAEYGVGHMKYLKLVREYYGLGHEELAEHWFDIALNMPQPKARAVMGNPHDVQVMAASLKYNVHLKKHDFKNALHWAKVRNKLLNGEDDKLVEGIEELADMQDAANDIFRYAKWLKDSGNKKELRRVLDTIPYSMRDEMFVQNIANEVIPPKKWEKGTIVYYAGNSFDPWNGVKVRKGMGGSETAIAMLSEQWAKDRKVVVYCNASEEGEYYGVEYKHFTKINWKDKFDTLIVWRNPGILDLPLKANKIIVDLHDVASQIDWTDERMEKADVVVFKSEYQRKMVPKLSGDKVKVISNGF